jgi:hypothetical protein
MTLKFELPSTDINLGLLIPCLRDSGVNSLKIDEDLIISGILTESDSLKAMPKLYAIARLLSKRNLTKNTMTSKARGTVEMNSKYKDTSL